MERDVYRFELFFDFLISTHTLTWSVTSETVGNVRGNVDFNSHAHVERDLGSLRHVHIIAHFNSHAHVERDGITMAETIDLVNFNSHAHVERDHTDFLLAVVLIIFQLTRSRGA